MKKMTVLAIVACMSMIAVSCGNNAAEEAPVAEPVAEEVAAAPAECTEAAPAAECAEAAPAAEEAPVAAPEAK